MKSSTKKQLKIDLTFSLLLTAFAFFSFYVGETLFEISTFNPFLMFLYWSKDLFLSIIIIKYFMKIKWRK